MTCTQKNISVVLQINDCTISIVECRENSVISLNVITYQEDDKMDNELHSLSSGMAGQQCKFSMARAYAVGLYTEDKQPVRNQIHCFSIRGFGAT